jgi:hypothetical protein
VAREETLGGARYDLGGRLLAQGRPEAAVAALDEAEEAYERSAARRAADRVADVQARRAVGRPVRRPALPR